MEPLGRFLEYSMESLESILKAPLGKTLGQKPSGPAAPRVFGLGSGLGGPSIYSLGTPLRTLGNLPRGSIHHYTPSAFPQIVPMYNALTAVVFIWFCLLKLSTIINMQMKLFKLN